MSKAEFIRIVTNNLLPNCLVTERDIMVAEDICGPDLGSVKGKTVRRRPLQVESDGMHTPLSPSVLERYQETILTGDIRFVNAIPFFEG